MLAIKREDYDNLNFKAVSVTRLLFVFILNFEKMTVFSELPTLFLFLLGGAFLKN